MKTILRFVALLLWLIISNQAGAQIEAPFFGSKPFINGYEKALQGESIPYFSVYANYAKEALLTRCTDGKKVIEWETSPIPTNAKGDYAYFTWIAAYSTGTSSGIRNFDLYINDVYTLTFTTFPKRYDRYLTRGGKDSTRLVLEYKVKDGPADAHGFAYLRVPLSKYKKGAPLRLKIVGQNQNSNDWYMTFKYSYQEKIDITPFPFLFKYGTQPIQFTVLHFGSPTTLFVNIDKKIEQKFYVKHGFNVFEIPVKAVTTNTTVQVEANLGSLLKIKKDINLKPVKFKEINLIHHSHTDIGYSHIQEEVIQIHNNNIRQALKLIDKTKSYPPGSRFIWNIESSWAVENFLSGATPTEKQEFFKAVKNKQIEISATYANILTGLSTPEEMHWITEYSRKLNVENSLPINTAMMSDIPGMSWSIVPALAKYGIKYFSNGPNYVESFPDKGDRVGNTLREQGNKAFWWKSSSGKDSILLWTCGKGYSSWHGVIQGGVYEKGADKIAAYINELDSIHYPYEMVQWRYNIVADNGPTDSTICDFVKQWNEKYDSPKLLLSSATDMFERFEKRYGKQIPTLSGDFTPYWEDGAYSTAKEEATVRMLSEKILQLEKLAKQNNVSLSDYQLYQAKRNILLFHEHTWGAWCSISRPDDQFTVHQWKYKKRFVDSAEYYVNHIETFINSALSDHSTINISNTLAWERTGYVVAKFPVGKKGNILIDDKENKTPIQKLSDSTFCFIAADVPANGAKTYHLGTAKKVDSPLFTSNISLVVDSTYGAIKLLKTLDKNWIDNKSFKGILQALYVKGFDPKLFSSTTVKKIEWMENGPVLRKLKITCEMEGTNQVVYEISQFNGLNTLQLSVIIDKKSIREKESVHIAFPFALRDAKVRISMDSSYITAGKDQIAGANKDFFSVQRWLDVSDKEYGVTISSPQSALFEVGNMVDETLNSYGVKTWKKETQSSSTVFAYALNNYWHTNYKIDQGGTVQFDFYLTFHDAFDEKQAERFGYESKQPLMSVGTKAKAK